MPTDRFIVLWDLKKQADGANIILKGDFVGFF